MEDLKIQELDKSSIEGRLHLWKKIKTIPDGEIKPLRND